LHRSSPAVEPRPAPDPRAGSGAFVLALVSALATAALLTGVGGCGGGSEGARLAEALAPHEETIETFSRWAVRATQAATARDPERLEERLFAPLSAEPRIEVAIVEREGRTPLRATRPHDATLPSDLAWTTVRSRRLGVVELARDPREPARLWLRMRVGEEEAAPLALTVALRPPPP
jgi:hypothetical protein